MTPPCFHTALRLEKVGSREWDLTDDLIFESVLLRGIVVMPKGSRINGASSPRFLWWLVPPSGAYDYGVALHDGGYRGTLRTQSGQRIRLIRRLADELMDEANAATGVDDITRMILFRGVRLFAGGAYKGVPDA